MRNPYGAGRQSHGGGYVAIIRRGHPLADKRGRVLEHRYIAWEAGLFDDPALEVHHRNGDKLDNRLENLEVLTTAEHASRHARERGITNQWGHFPAKDHGTVGAYQRGCRCRECTQANTDACRRYRENRRRREAVA